MSQVAKVEEIAEESYPPPTPMMEQFLGIKSEHQEYLLFYRMGDFYELFLEDALIASDALNITLTHRGQHKGKPLPMCGVPFHSYQSYLYKLIEKGFKVAICEQLENPQEAKKRGAKSVVKRGVTRIVTAGTIVEEGLLNATESNYLMALNVYKDVYAIAWIDISTGEFNLAETTLETLASDMARIEPKEILVHDKLWGSQEFNEKVKDWKKHITPYSGNFFDARRGEQKLKKVYQIASLDVLEEMSHAELGVLGAILEYMELTQKEALPRITIPKKLQAQQYMTIDAGTRKSLEFTSTMSGQVKGSLFSVINKTVTGAGARELHKYLMSPLMEVQEIHSRQQKIAFFLEHTELRFKVREILTATPDIERSLSRLYMGRGGPKDMVALRVALKASLSIQEVMEFSGITLPKIIIDMLNILGNHTAIVNYLSNALNDEVVTLARDGGFIKQGFNASLDQYQSMHSNAKRLKQELRDRYAKELDISTLKIKDNNVIGFFVEITPQHAEKIPDYFVHRQTLGGCVRYTTPELKELEHKIINAKGYALDLELQLFEEVAGELIRQAEVISLTAQILAQLDVFAALAELAEKQKYCCPKIDDSHAFVIEKGRHPVVETLVDEGFVGNDCRFDKGQMIWLITGPNMAGKSTFLRQNALIAVLAQMGSYVPAELAHIGIVDRIFSRVGAADDLARGQSTFMVEMVETATILHHATDRSLVILDEIGRGTSTFDGLSIAWSVVEYLHDVNTCRALFATHYHEMNHLVNCLDHLASYTVKVREWKKEIIFLHEIIAGSADKSYGIHVGKIAGLPQAVVRRAEEVLDLLREGDTGSAINRLVQDLPLFQYVQHNEDLHIAQEKEVDAIYQQLQALSMDDLSPRQAHELLYQLHQQAKEKQLENT